MLVSRCVLSSWATGGLQNCRRGRRTMLDKVLPSKDLFGDVRVPPEPAITRRSRITNNPTSARFNRSSASGRRQADLLRGFLAEMGNPTDVVAQSAAIRAAELTAAAEDARRDLLAGKGNVNLEQVGVAENMARRAVRDLGIDRQRRSKPRKTLADYVREKTDAKVGAA